SPPRRSPVPFHSPLFYFQNYLFHVFKEMNSQLATQPAYRCFVETDKRAYYPGDRVSCNIELTFDRRFNCEEIITVCTGEMRVYWIEKQVSETALCRHQAYYQKRGIFEQKKPIWSADLVDIGKKKESSLSDIVRFASPNSIRPGNLLLADKKKEFRGFEAGKHVFPVEFQLPEEGIYSSLEVEGELVSIRYQIEIHCLVDGRITKKFHQLLHVFAPRDLSEDMDKLSRPTHSEKVLQCKIGKLSATLALPKTGYTPGEPLCAQVTVHNMTSNSVKFASVSIATKTTAIADKPNFEIRERDDETAGSILPFHKIQRGEKKEWVAQINVPALTPSFCIEDFIHVNYNVKLSVGFERGKKKDSVLHIKIPITIGTVAINTHNTEATPLKVDAEKSSEQQQSREYEMQLRQRMINLNGSVRTGLPSAPPSYEEAMSQQIPHYSSTCDDPVPYSD
ncbi:hypothetical protein PMAYCL1PPCAC_09860, partial [Pristionchus mayeri]